MAHLILALKRSQQYKDSEVVRFGDKVTSFRKCGRYLQCIKTK